MSASELEGKTGVSLTAPAPLGPPGAPFPTMPETGLFFEGRTVESAEATQSAQSNFSCVRFGQSGENGQKPRGVCSSLSAHWPGRDKGEGGIRRRARRGRRTIDLSFGDLR